MDDWINATIRSRRYHTCISEMICLTGVFCDHLFSKCRVLTLRVSAVATGCPCLATESMAIHCQRDDYICMYSQSRPAKP